MANRKAKAHSASAVCEMSVPFSLSLLKKLTVEGKNGTTAENTFCSPASISIALGMTLAGAGGQTLDEMRKCFFNAVDEPEIHAGLNTLVDSLKSDPNVKNAVMLHTANRLYAMAGFGLESEFLGVLKERYSSDLKQVDFVTAAEEARLEINNYVTEITRKKINDLIAKGVLTALTRLVIVNAIYFKGDWVKKFDPNATKDKTFHLNKNEKIQIPMMCMEDKFRYGERDDCQVLVMPYVSNDLAFVIVLPRAVDGLSSLVENMTPEALVELVKHTRQRDVIVQVPKFKLEASFDLSETLKSMGATSMFDESRADFTRITKEPPGLFVSAVIHKAFIEVNEEGSEAAAATAVVMNLRCAMPRPMEKVKFTAERPFMFFIWNVNLNYPLFAGQFVKS